MESEGLTLCSQGPATISCPELDEVVDWSFYGSELLIVASWVVILYNLWLHTHIFITQTQT
jgi:hypothetical protein